MTQTPPDLPIAFLVGYAAPVQPEHPNKLARLGVTGVRGDHAEGRQHIAHEVRYAPDTFALAIRPGWDGADPRTALAWEMYRVAIGRHASLAEGLEAAAAERDPDSHEFEPATLRIDGVEHEAVQLHEYGMVARAAVVDGWTVVAAVPAGQQPAVELHALAESVAD